MSVFTVCKKDPLLDFIRDTYDAHPMRMPDKRIKPMTLLTAVDKRHRYLGSIAESVMSSDWDAPQVHEVDLPNLDRRDSGGIRLDVAIRLLGPFLEETLGQSVSLDIKGIAATEVSISLRDAQRQYISPIDLHKALKGEQLLHPLPQDDRWKLYVVDSVLISRDLVITRKSSRGVNVGAAIGNQLAGVVSADALLVGDSSIEIRRTDVPFAFTCFAVDVDEDPILTPDSGKYFSFTGAGSGSEAVTHAIVGETNEFIEFE